MRSDVAAAVAMVCACAIAAAVAPTLSGARNPALLFATPLTGSGPVRSAIDSRGFIYLAGNLVSTPGTIVNSTAAFVTKLTPSGNPLYTTYFRAARFAGEHDDCGIDITAIAVDPSGAAYVTGCTSAVDFPLVRPVVATLPEARGSVFVAKLDTSGALVYSTYFPAHIATAIAADADGNAYVVGDTGAGTGVPLVNAALTDGIGFAAKLDPSGGRILYSTYVDATVRAVAVDRAGAAFLAGTGQTFVSRTGRAPLCHNQSNDAMVIKLAPSGSRYDYAVCLGGSDSDDATGIAVDSSGAAYVVGTTSSVDFPTVRPIDQPLHTGAVWKTVDAGGTWTNLPVSGSPVLQLVATPAELPAWFANSLSSFRSTDQGRTWQRLAKTVFRVASDPRSPHTVYGTSFDGLYKSPDDGEHWTATGEPPGGNAFGGPVVIDPRDSSIYAINRGVWKSLDGGATWAPRNTGLGQRPTIDALAVDPANGALFADNFTNDDPRAVVNRIFTSVDGGTSWAPTSLGLENRLFSSLLIVRGRHEQLRPVPSPNRGSPPDEPTPSGASTIYVAARQRFGGGPAGILARSDDGGATWTAVGAGLPGHGVDLLAAAQRDPALIYAAASEGLFVSRDHGETFQHIAKPWPAPVTALAIDPRDSRIVFAGSWPESDAFVAKITPDGGALEYATYVGGTSSDAPVGVAVDDLGRAIVFGSTFSEDFPSVLPVQQRGGGLDGFVSVLDGGGSVLLTSTWIGGRGTDQIKSLALRGRELIISGGSNDLANLFPGAEMTAGGFVGVLDLSYGASDRSRALGIARR